MACYPLKIKENLFKKNKIKIHFTDPMPAHLTLYNNHSGSTITMKTDVAFQLRPVIGETRMCLNGRCSYIP